MDIPEQIEKPKLLPHEEYDRMSYKQLMEMASDCLKSQSLLNKYGIDLQRQLTRVPSTRNPKRRSKSHMLPRS